MYLGLCLMGVIACVWAIAAFASSPRTGTTGPRDHDRRWALVRACPDRATILDVESLLRAHPLPERTVARVLGTAAERRISARTLWCWADRFGADKLVLAIDADLVERRLQRHLDAGTTPDWGALEVFAQLNNDTARGIRFEELVALAAESAAEPTTDAADDPGADQLAGWETSEPGAATPVTIDPELSQFDRLPPIYDPGLPVTRTAAPPAGKERPKAGGDDPWPMVA